MRPTNYKFAGWVDVIFDLIIKKMSIFWIFCFYPWDKNIDNIFFDFCQHLFLRIKIIMLG